MPDTYYDWPRDKDECLSEGGGCHIVVTAGAAAGLLLVTSGDFVVYGQMFGVALTDYEVASDSFVLDVCGGHNLPVLAEDNAGNSAVDIGDWIYWDATAGLLNKDATDGDPVGQALEAITAGETATICVVLRPSPPT